MNASAASRRSGERPGLRGITNVCASAWLAGRSKIVGTVRMPNFIFMAWYVVTSHSPLSAKAAVPLPKNATEPW